MRIDVSYSFDLPEEMLQEGIQKAVEKEVAKRAWIPVSERLPEVFKEVIVCRSSKQGVKVEAGSLEINGWWRVYGTRTKNVTHWQPLPEPPGGEANG